jgi:hypothetical protein
MAVALADAAPLMPSKTHAGQIVARRQSTKKLMPVAGDQTKPNWVVARAEAINTGA